MCVHRETPFGDNSLCTPVLFASYRLGDVPGAGLRFFPWDITRTEAILINAYDFTRPKFRRALEAGWTPQTGLQSGTRPVLIDSGAYYLLRRAQMELDPEIILQIQQRSGADVAVVLDHPFAPHDSDRAARIQKTLQNTEIAFRWAREFGLTVMPVVHGSTEQELRECVQAVRRLAERYGVPLRYVGVGSLAPRARCGDGRTAMFVLSTVRRLLPEVHLHCFSMGSALNMLLAFAAGVDSVDSQAWVVSAGLKLAQLPGRYICRMARRGYASEEAFAGALRGFAEHLYWLVEAEGFSVCDWDTGVSLPLRSLTDSLEYAWSLVDTHSNEHVHRRACHNLWSYNYEVQQVREALRTDTWRAFLRARLQGTRYYQAIGEYLK